LAGKAWNILLYNLPTLHILMDNHQLKDCLNSKGERLVFVLNSLLNDCGCSKPSS